MERYSPLRYPGGKAKVVPFLRSYIEVNGLKNGIYVEPYVGGGAVALALLMSGLVEQIYINDKDRSIYAFWHSVLYRTEEFSALIEDTPITMEVWYRQREIKRKKEVADLLELGFSTFFLNRTNRSGILSGGVIGGLNQQGKYKIDARFNKASLISRIRAIGDMSEKIHLFNEDAIDLLSELSGRLPVERTLYYLDPPYYVKGKGLYLNHYKEQDHRDISFYISKLRNHKWLISYDNAPFIVDLYKDFRQVLFELIYSASNSGKGQEIMIFSPQSIIPSEAIVNYKSKTYENL